MVEKLLVVDTDTGVDDALALALLTRTPGVELAGVHSTHGNCGAERAADNARYVLELCGRGDVDVHIGLPAPARDQHSYSANIHGEDGLGNTWVTPGRPPITQPGAPENLVALAERHPGRIDLLALGPLTNVAAALRLDPMLFDKLHSVTIVGSLGPTRFEDPTPWTDPRFRVSRDPNVSHDIASALLVAQTPGPVTWCGPYITRQCLVPERVMAEQARETGDPVARFIMEISRFYTDFYTESYPQPDGARVMGINDGIAAAILLRPELVLGAVERPLREFTDPEGISYLAGVHRAPGDSAPGHRLVFDVDFHRIIDMLTSCLGQDDAGARSRGSRCTQHT